MRHGESMIAKVHGLKARFDKMKLSLSLLVAGAAAFQAPSHSARAPTELAATKSQVRASHGMKEVLGAVGRVERGHSLRDSSVVASTFRANGLVLEMIAHVTHLFGHIVDGKQQATESRTVHRGGRIVLIPRGRNEGVLGVSRVGIVNVFRHHGHAAGSTGVRRKRVLRVAALLALRSRQECPYVRVARLQIIQPHPTSRQPRRIDGGSSSEDKPRVTVEIGGSKIRAATEYAVT